MGGFDNIYFIKPDDIFLAYRIIKPLKKLTELNNHTAELNFRTRTVLIENARE